MNTKSTLSHRGKEPEKGILYLVGTPIGNLSDISPRALNILKNVSLIASEDTRQTKKIMTKNGFSNKLMSFNKINSAKKIQTILKSLKNGYAIAVVSDAGMPGICDPGENLVKESRLNDIDVICIPGPCAALTALTTSGFESSKFTFEGFLPKKKLEREKLLFEISNNKKTTIIYESPHRFMKTLNELKNYCGGNKEIQISRELTKKYEENVGKNIDEAIEYFNKKEILGELTIVIKGSGEKEIKKLNESYLKKELQELIDLGLSLSAASKYLAKKKNISKKAIYNLHK
jgi:16S rRNA (cytidine1402-2'-O)-methyltransferase